MRIDNRVFDLDVDRRGSWLAAIGDAWPRVLDEGTYPLRFSIVDLDRTTVTIEATTVTFEAEEPFTETFGEIEVFSPRSRSRASPNFGVVQVVPTGIGCELGGYAGDACPSTNLLAAAADMVITHPNAVNASDLNEMADNVLYVEGRALDDFLLGHVGLRPVRSNRVATFVDPTGGALVDDVLHVLDAARAVKGIDCADCMILDRPPGVEIAWSEAGCAVGTVSDPEAFLDAVAELLADGADAIGGVSVISGVTREQFAAHLDGDAPNPSGGVEAIITHLITKVFGVPTAHAPLPYYTDIKDPSARNPRAAAEFVSTPHYFCVLKGLARAPRLVRIPSPGDAAPDLVTLDGVGAVVVPADALGGVPALVAEYHDIPLIAVAENRTVLDMTNERMQMPNVIPVASYAEAAGVVLALRSGISLESIGRPLAPVQPRTRGQSGRATGQAGRSPDA